MGGGFCYIRFGSDRATARQARFPHWVSLLVSLRAPSGGAMREAESWRDAISRWVRLADVPGLVQREFPAAWPECETALRQACEGYRIQTEVRDWPHGTGIEDSSLVRIEDGRTIVSPKGWDAVIWKTGTLKGYPVYALWPHTLSTCCTQSAREPLARARE